MNLNLSNGVETGGGDGADHRGRDESLFTLVAFTRDAENSEIWQDKDRSRKRIRQSTRGTSRGWFGSPRFLPCASERSNCSRRCIVQGSLADRATARPNAMPKGIRLIAAHSSSVMFPGSMWELEPRYSEMRSLVTLGLLARECPPSEVIRRTYSHWELTACGTSHD